MTHARFVSAVLSSVLIVFFACSAAAQCDPAIGHVTFTSPGAGATVTAPINVLAGATSSCRLTSIQIYLDGILQWTQYRQNILHVSLSAAIGRHTLQVKGWNAAGKSFTSDHVVYVKSVLADKCQSPFNLDNSVWPCKPLEYAVNDSPAWIEAKVRSDTAPLLHTNIVVNGALWAIADGDAASHPAADFMLPPGLYYADIASSNTAGVAMHNPVTFTVRSQVACQAPVVSVMDPTPDNGHPLGQPIMYVAAADGGRQCPITSVRVYVDGHAQYIAWNQSLIVGRLWMPAGIHRITVQAWNSHGQVGKSTRTLNAEENVEAFCVPPTTPGVMLCSAEPLRVGPVVGVGTPVDPPIPTTAARIYVNGVKRADYYADAMLRSYMLVALPPGTYTIKAVAWNAAGVVSTDTNTFKVAP